MKNDALGFLKAVEVALESKMEKYDQFLKIVRDFNSKIIHRSCMVARVKMLLEGHDDLILGFNNTFLSVEHDEKDEKKVKIEEICLSMEQDKKKVKTEEILCQLPWDALDVISQKLDFDDLFQFSGVCANWRAFHKFNFMASQEPLLVEILSFPYINEPHSFSSLTNKKVYDLTKTVKKMMTHSKLPFPMYITYSSGYFILAQKNNSFILINPFTRIKKVIYTSTFQVNVSIDNRYHALLAFEKCSEDEFVLVILCKVSSNLHIYQSRNNIGWVTYSTSKKIVVDFVVLHNIIYVVTDKANVGVLSLNSADIKFLKLKNTPYIHGSRRLNLVNCDDQLLVLDLTPGLLIKLAYKIDLSSMTYVKLKTLGDIALFFTWWENCKALSNPNRWGYKSNSVYEVTHLIPDIIEYNWDKRNNNQGSDRYIPPPRPKKTNCSRFDWCFRHLKYQLDYSLVD